MILSPMGAGLALCLAREELPPVLTRRTLLPLVRRALVQAGRPVPAALEVSVFPAHQGALVLVRPRLSAQQPASPLLH